VQARKRSRI